MPWLTSNASYALVCGGISSSRVHYCFCIFLAFNMLSAYVHISSIILCVEALFLAVDLLALVG